ncbi:MAG: glycosyltransferase [candidate division Zixibacteria bacterium]|nr:glycosyltransferase [candidate division Zixibacteria bacterium]MBU1469567.1 glycosyltransferase [candidate division Zixibacteria bacterium]MBU2624101.1 glycosyltransferase [candidate division Zixibacteria bacterium]
MKLRMDSKPDIVCIATQDWNDLWTRKQRFMKRFSEEGFRVLFVETQVHWITYIREFRHRINRAFKFMKGATAVKENLWVATPPLVLPFFQMNTFICKLNSLLLSWFIKRQIRRLGFNDPVIYSYTPYSGYLMRRLKSSRKLYECVDEFVIDKGMVRKETVARLERDTILQSDAMVATAPFLLERKGSMAKRTYLIPNAADIDHYRGVNLDNVKPNDEITNIPGPIVGFLGSVAYWIDLELIAYVAEKLPHYSFVFVGPAHVDTSRLSGYDNVFFLGRKTFDELPSYIAAFDVCMNPYILDDVASGCSPLKLYEYMAAGKPIVSVRMPEAEKFVDLVEIADSYEEFAQKIEWLISRNKTWKRDFAERAWTESQNHTWGKRFEQTMTVFEECFNENRN